MPSPLSKVRDRLPEVLDRAEETLQTLREIVRRIPESLDRSDRFFTNVERIVQESDLPALSADSRKFFATTSTQIEQLTTDLDRLIGTGGTLLALVEETRACDQCMPTFPARPSPRAMRWTVRASRPTICGDRLPAIRDSLQQMRELARPLEEQPESVVYGPRPSE